MDVGPVWNYGNFVLIPQDVYANIGNNGVWLHHGRKFRIKTFDLCVTIPLGAFDQQCVR